MLRSLFTAVFISLSVCAYSAPRYETELKIQQAVADYQNGGTEAAKENLLSLEKKVKNDVRIYFYLGMIAYDQNDLQSAEKYYKKVISLDSKYSPAYSELSAINIKRNNLPEAKKYAEKAVRLDPSNVNANLNYLSVLTMQNNKEQEKKQLIKTAKLDFSKTMNYANMYLNETTVDTALFFYSTLCEVNPEEPLVYNNIASCYRILKDYNNALYFAEKGFKLTETNKTSFPIVYFTYSWTLLENNRPDDVIKLASGADSNSLTISYYFSGLANYKLKNEEKFQENIRNYFKLSKKDLPDSLDKWADGILNRN